MHRQLSIFSWHLLYFAKWYTAYSVFAMIKLSLLIVSGVIPCGYLDAYRPPPSLYFMMNKNRVTNP